MWATRFGFFRTALLVPVVTATITSLGFGPTASSQEAEQAEPQIERAAVQEPGATTFEDEITVTGTLIPRPSLDSLSPVTVLDAPQELTLSGTVRIEDLVSSMPQVFAGQNSTIANGATGTASVVLRDLGAVRTLTLLNGRRMAYGDFIGADLNAIPASLIKRVDVLTGGASTVYGSDAMAGVVNFIMDNDFTGVRGGIQYSFYNHDNDNTFAQDLNLAAGFDPPTGTVNDGNAINANVAFGSSFADGKGHAVAYLDYRKIDALTKASRDYVACSVGDGPDGPVCGGSSTTPRGIFWVFDAEGGYSGRYTLDLLGEGGDGHSFRPWAGERFNYGPYNHIQRPDEKYNAGAFANYEINERFDLYMEIMYMDDYTHSEIAPSGEFGSAGVVNCDNPMLSEQQHNLICVQGGYADDEYAEVYIGRRIVESGPRINQLGHTNSRLVGGLRGDINGAWSYDLYLLRAQSNLQDVYLNDFNVDRIADALDVIEHPDTGAWVCRDPQARANGCLPLNFFQEGAVSQEAMDYVLTAAVLNRKNRTEVANLTVTGDLEDHGLVIPSASEGLQLAVGAEYRSEWLSNMPDEVYLVGTAGMGGARLRRFEGGYNVTELFLETLVPIVQDARGARDFSLELGYRHSDYSTSGGFNTYKGLLNWAITDSWRLRGGYNRAVRVPSIRELYRPVRAGGSWYVDLCEGESPVATFEECARTGVTEEQYGNIFEWPAEVAGSNTHFGGNPLLDPETGDTVTAGLVWTPAGIPGLSVTFDYYNIEISDAIGRMSAETVHRVCMDTGDPFYCSLIHRDAHGTISLLDMEGYTDLIDQNLGSLGSEGIDLNLNHLIDLGDAGYLSTDLMGSYLLSQSFTNPEIDYECAGYFGLECGQPKSLWRHRLRTTWETPYPLNLSLAWRYLGGAENEDASPSPDLGDPDALEHNRINGVDTVRAYYWFDLAATYTFRGGIKLTLGVNNILDEEPPLMAGLADNPGTVFNLYGSYDPLGRYVFSSLQFDF